MIAHRTTALAAALVLLAPPAPPALRSPSHSGSMRQSDSLAPRSKGRPTAPVTVYEMADFQCPACRTFALNTLPVIERDYIATGKVRWVFVNFPLTQIHRNAVAAAELAMCAARQNKFWAVHDLLYQHQDEWAPQEEPGPSLIALGVERGGLARPALVQCLTTRATRAEVEADAQRAVRAGARATPSFYIEGGILAGAAPADVFRRVLDSVYTARTSRSSR